MRRVIAIVLLLVAAAAPAARAQEVGVTPGSDDRVDAFVRREREEDRESSAASGPRTGRQGRQSDDRDRVRVRDVAYGTNDDGERCIRIITVWVDAEDAPPEDSENARIVRLADRYPMCPGSEPLPDVPAASALADRFWRDEVPLPSPSPSIQPDDGGIVAIPVYLEIGGRRDGEWRFEAFGIEIVITADSVYDVDWGDGTVQRGLTSQGRPYPDGDVRHGYQYKGTYDIVVTQRWTARWRASTGESGTIAGVLQTQGRVEDFVVTEVQAVRER